MTINLPALFLTSAGRIGRLRFWIGALALFFLGDSAISFFRSWFDADVQPQLIDFGITAVLAWPDFCVGRKRLADRGKGIGYALVYTGYGLAAALLAVVFPFLTEKPDGSLPFNLFWAVYFTMILYFVIECGFLEGNKGSNAYGPEPELP